MHKGRSSILSVRWLMAAIAAGCALGASHAQAQWKPEKGVEIVVGTSPGGGQDTSARFLQKLIQERQLVDVPTVVVNKPGGGSSVGYAYLNQHPGDGHFIMLLTVPLITNHILGLSQISHAELSPLAVLFDEYIAAAVAPQSPIGNAQDLMARLRKDPASLSIGVPSLTGGGYYAIALAAKAHGIDPKRLKTVVFKSGGDSITALLGGHIDVMFSTLAAPTAQLRAGKVRMLAVAAPRRLAGELAQVPTFREQGTNVVFSNWRGIVGPRGLSGAQVAYWEEVLAKVAAADEFKRDVEQRNWVANFQRSDAMRRFLKDQHDELRVLLTDLGQVK
jgi:putative tricarboxylic transport membrane protein